MSIAECLILIKTNSGTTQDVTYSLDASEDQDVLWLEPYFFESDDNFKIPIANAEQWIYIDDI